MRKILISTLVVFLATQLLAGSGFEVKYTRPESQVMQLDFTIGEYSIGQIQQNGITYSKINFEGQVTTQKQGFAELPYINSTVKLAADKNVSLKVSGGTYVDYQLDFPLLPSRGVIYRNQNPDEIPYEIDPASLTDSWYPAEMAKNTSPFIMKDIRGTSVYVYPFLYNAANKTLRVYSDVSVQLVENNSICVNPLTQEPQEILKEMDGIYSSLFINYQETKDNLTIGQYGDILVVCTSRDEIAMQPYVDWKKEKGYNVSIETVATATNVKTTIQNAYNANNNILYVQLVGDWADIKCDLIGGAPMDPQLGCVVGGDAVADITIGRISANSAAQVTVQIDKIINYEKYPDISGTWYKGALGVGSAEGSGIGDDGEVDKNHIQNIWDNKLNPFTFDDYFTAYDPGGSISQVNTAISSGVSIVNYCGHGSASSWGTTGFSSNNAAALTNGNMLPWVISVACNNGNFHDPSDCFAEYWVKNSNGGAVMFLGATISQPWTPPMRGQDYFNDILIGGYDYTLYPGQNGITTNEQRSTLGSIIFNGLALMVAESGTSSDWETAKTWILFGDPSMQPRTDTPGNLSLSNNVILVGLDYSTTITGPNGPVEGAMVCLAQNGQYFKAISDGSGSVSIPQTLEPGTAQLVVTAFNMETVIDDITVVPPTGAYVLLDNFEIDDSNGNNNGLADFNEYIMLDMELSNVGNITASNLIATISTSDEYVSIDIDNHNWPDITAGATSAQTGAFAFTVSDIIPDQHNVTFNIEITDGTDVWSGTFNQILNAPVLSVGAYTIDDSEGNNNGRMDPGETVDVIIQNMNEGGCDALNAFANMSNSNPLLTLNNTSFDLGNIASGNSGDAIFNITISPAAPVGEAISVGYMLSSDPYSTTAPLSFTIGLIVEDFETGDFTAFPWEFSGNANWQISTTTPYEGDYSAKSGTISHSQVSSMTVNASVSTAGQISFFYKVSSETSYDFLTFYIDGSVQDEWSGDIDWTEATFDVGSGDHAFKWEYSKDGSVSSGSDAAWVDFIVFPAIAGSAPLAVIASATPASICAGENTQLYAFAMGGNGTYTYAWMPETSLSDPTIANPVATPSVTTTYYVVVSDGDNNVNDNIQVTVNPLPDQPEITQSGITLVSSSDVGNQWYDSNGAIPDATEQIFTPIVTDSYYVIVTNTYGCSSVPSDSYYFLFTGITELEKGQNVNVFPNPFNGQFTIDYSLATPSKVNINIYNTFGQKIVALEENAQKDSGNHSILFNGRRLDPGIYFLKIESSDYSITKRIIHSK